MKPSIISEGRAPKNRIVIRHLGEVAHVTQGDNPGARSTMSKSKPSFFQNVRAKMRAWGGHKAAVCPECGGEMADGKCTKCGYMGAGKEANDGGGISARFGPECGGEMADGKCTKCGYMGAGKEANDGGGISARFGALRAAFLQRVAAAFNSGTPSDADLRGMVENFIASAGALAQGMEPSKGAVVAEAVKTLQSAAARTGEDGRAKLIEAIEMIETLDLDAPAKGRDEPAPPEADVADAATLKELAELKAKQAQDDADKKALAEKLSVMEKKIADADEKALTLDCEKRFRATGAAFDHAKGADMIKRAHKADPQLAKDFEAFATAMHAQLTKAQDIALQAGVQPIGPTGTEGLGDDANGGDVTPMGKLQTIATAMVAAAEKDGKELSPEAAFIKACNENPKLYAAHRKAEDARKMRQGAGAH